MGGYSLPKKKSGSGKPATQNTDITVFAGEQFSGNSETFEASNSQFKTNFDISFKEPVKSIIIAGVKGESLIIVKPECDMKVIPGYCIRSPALPEDQPYWRRASELNNMI